MSRIRRQIHRALRARTDGETRGAQRAAISANIGTNLPRTGCHFRMAAARPCFSSGTACPSRTARLGPQWRRRPSPRDRDFEARPETRQLRAGHPALEDGVSGARCARHAILELAMQLPSADAQIAATRAPSRSDAPPFAKGGCRLRRARIYCELIGPARDCPRVAAQRAQIMSADWHPIVAKWRQRGGVAPRRGHRSALRVPPSGPRRVARNDFCLAPALAGRSRFVQPRECPSGAGAPRRAHRSPRYLSPVAERRRTEPDPPRNPCPPARNRGWGNRSGTGSPRRKLNTAAAIDAAAATPRRKGWYFVARASPCSNRTLARTWAAQTPSSTGRRCRRSRTPGMSPTVGCRGGGT